MSPVKASGQGQIGKQVGREEFLGRQWQSQGPVGRAKVLGWGGGSKGQRMMGAGGAGLSGCCGELGFTQRPQQSHRGFFKIQSAVWRVA